MAKRVTKRFAAASPLPDLAAQQPGAVRLWEKRLRTLLQAAGETLDAPMRTASALTEEQRRQLASLGYLAGGTGGTVRRDLPDPRRRMDLANALHAASALVQQNKCPEALPALQDVVRRDPHNVPAIRLTGFCLEQAGRLDSALAAYRQASRENELSAEPLANAGACLIKLGRRAEAETELRRALTLDPTLGLAAAQLGQLLRERGLKADALRVLDTALAAGTHEEQVYEERGNVLAELGRLADALRDFRESARRNPLDPLPLEKAAQIAYRLGQPRDAALLYERLLQIQPNRLDAWKAAGALYLETDDKENAVRCFRRALTFEYDPAEKEKLTSLVKELGG